ncbi:MAG: carboxylating nicotinate-nucleotide diphosphorylase [Bacteroidales bacterium]|nr:MAG: carboxylating nicotinate-nucleotide diphosphorylase [Bacteroidales bacterium]
METALIDRLIDLAITEDIGDGDHSALSCIPADAVGKVKLMVKQQGIIAGIEIAKRIYRKIDRSIQLEQLISDGAAVKYGDIVFYASGRDHSLLQSERIVLNVMQRMSGIATQTNQYVKLLEGTKAKVLDTRKTTPGMRVFDKMAVRIGGGENHRMGLFDMIMLKDNHVDFAGGIEEAIRKANEYLTQTGRKLGIEIETRNLNEVERVLLIGNVQRIMLDNFNLDDTRKAVTLINGRFETESSGGINRDTIRGYAECGVDYISVGAITHQIQSIDMNLKKV